MIRTFPSGPARRQLELLAAGRHDTLVATAAALGIDRVTLWRVLTRPYLRSDAADRIAVAMGHHPCELWPEWFSLEKETS